MANKHRNRVSIYSREANPEVDGYLLRKSYGYAATLVECNQARWLVPGVSVQLTSATVMDGPRSDDGDSNLRSDGARGEITRRESELNAAYVVGETRERNGLDSDGICRQRYIRVAHQKVVRWPDVHERRAVTIHAGKAWIPDEKASRKRAEDRRIESLSMRHLEQQQANQRLRAAGVA